MFKIFKSRSILSLLLVFAMTLSLLPGTAFATDVETGEHVHTEECSHEEGTQEAAEEGCEETAPSEDTGEDTTPIEESTVDEEPVPGEEASQPMYSGTVGESAVLWSFNPANGQLTITGNGDCDTFHSADDQPWAHLRTEIREVWFNSMDSLAIENLAFWFDGCAQLRIAEVPYTTSIIGERAFADAPHLEELRIYYYDEDNFEIVQSAFETDLPSALTVFLISEQHATVHEVRTYDWATDNRTVGLCDVYSYLPLVGCSLTGCSCASCDWYYHYEPATATQHQQQVMCTNCDARFGLEMQSHTFSGNYCTTCGYSTGSSGGDYEEPETPSVCYHYYTSTSWYGCDWYEYCDNLNQLTKRVHEMGRIYDADIMDIRQSQDRILDEVSVIVKKLASLK